MHTIHNIYKHIHEIIRYALQLNCSTLSINTAAIYTTKP